jgi:serine/threonine protein phosphatase 1
MIYCVGDVHGCLEELKDLLGELKIDPIDEFVFLGDYVDRGPNSKGVIEYLINFSKNHKCTFLMGNHEDMFINYIKNPNFSNASLYLYPVNGGQQTMASYGTIEDIPQTHIEFLNN